MMEKVLWLSNDALQVAPLSRNSMVQSHTSNYQKNFKNFL